MNEGLGELRVSKTLFYNGDEENGYDLLRGNCVGIRDRTLQEYKRCDKISAVLYLDYENNNRRKIEYEKSENL